MSDKRRMKVGDEVMLRVRVSEKDVHYAGGLVNGAWVMSLFGDIATEIAIRCDGDEGLIRAYSSIDLLAPIHAGDFIEVVGKLVKMGITSRGIEIEAKRSITTANLPEDPSAMDVLDKPAIVAKAALTTVVPKELQRFKD